MKTSKKRAARQRRHARVRQRIQGTAERPRMSVYRSNAEIYVQLIDDRNGHTLVSASSLESDLSPDGDGKIGVSKAVGKRIAERARQAGFDAVVFDRGGNRYHGRVAALAEGAREGGLEF